MRTRLGLKAFILSALVTSTMAAGTSSVAHAEAGACWGYQDFSNLRCFSSLLEPRPLFNIENKTATLLIADFNHEFLCTSVALIEGGALSGDGSILLGRLEFNGCIFYQVKPKMIWNTCFPKITTEKGTGLIVLHNGEPVVELKPDEAGVIAKVFLAGEQCPFFEELLISGKLVLQDAGGKASFEEHKLSHLFREFPQLQLMTVGTHKATIDGTLNLALEAPHNAYKWSGKGA